MKRIVMLAAAIPCVAYGQTQFRPPGGLPLDTQVGLATNSSGVPYVTLGTMQSSIDAATANISVLQSSSVSKSDLSSALSAYLTAAASDARYATPASVSSAVQSEEQRAKAAESRNADDISSIRSDYVTTGALDSELGSYVTGDALSSALSSYLTKSDAAATYLPLSGGVTTGALNGAEYISLVGSSESGATATLSIDGTGTISPGNCMLIPPEGVTELTINVGGVSSNGSDAVMQRFSGAASYASNGTRQLNNGSASNNYPSFGSPGSWSVVPSVDTATGCLVLKASAGGSGRWKWQATVHYENLTP